MQKRGDVTHGLFFPSPARANRTLPDNDYKSGCERGLRVGGAPKRAQTQVSSMRPVPAANGRVVR